MNPKTASHTQHVIPANAGIPLSMDSRLRGNEGEMNTVTESSV
jgi:hypothetical protein